MITISPIALNSPARLASASVQGDNWCGTPMPSRPVPTKPIPFPHPTAVALARVNEGYQAMLEADSALNPNVTMQLPGGPIKPNFDIATAASAKGIEAIEQALQAYPVVRNEARTAIETALVEARRGYRMLTSVPQPAFTGVSSFVRDAAIISLVFNSAATKLDLASKLMAGELELDRPAPPLPTPLYPSNPDGPVSADSMTIQRPSADSRIQ